MRFEVKLPIFHRLAELYLCLVIYFFFRFFPFVALFFLLICFRSIYIARCFLSLCVYRSRWCKSQYIVIYIKNYIHYLHKFNLTSECMCYIEQCKRGKTDRQTTVLSTRINNCLIFLSLCEFIIILLILNILCFVYVFFFLFWFPLLVRSTMSSFICRSSLAQHILSMIVWCLFVFLYALSCVRVDNNNNNKNNHNKL